MKNRPIAAFVLGVLSLIGLPLSRTLVRDADPGISYLQFGAAVGAVILAWRELRDPMAERRWRLLAGLGGLLGLLFLLGSLLFVLLLWLTWPT